MTKKEFDVYSIQKLEVKVNGRENVRYKYDSNNNEQTVLNIEQNNQCFNPNKSTVPKNDEKEDGCFKRIFRRKKTEGKSEIDIAKEVNFTEHLLTFAELEQKFQTSIENGISNAEAEFRLARDGPNVFSKPKVTPSWVLLLQEWCAGFSILFWIAGIASMICYAFQPVPQNYILAIVLFGVVLLTGTWSWHKKKSSGKLFDSFKKMTPPATTVIRDGKQLSVPAEKLVVGDLVYFKSGERVPADVRVIRCEGMKVDNSSLTGESEPLSRSPEAGHQMPLEAKNLAFFSTYCVDGSGYGIVIATGDDTVMGKIAKLVTNLETVQSPISKEIYRFVVFIAISSITEGIIFFCVCLGLKMDVIDAILFTIGIITGNIPECLLPAVTVSLTLCAKVLAKKHCMIKYLEAVEILGSTSVICSDKTGTLTENRMTVEHCYLASKIMPVSHEREEVTEDMRLIQECWDMYQRCAKLCSRATFTDTDLDIMKRAASGDASETGILRFMESVSVNTVEEYRKQYPKVAEKPFSSVYKYQYSVHRYLDNQKGPANYFVVMKGAPERILKVCSRILDASGETRPLTDEDMSNFEEAYRELGSMGERVLAFCDMDLYGFEPGYKFNLDEGNDFAIENLRFIGLVAMIDPPRASVPDAVKKCKDAGISVIMVTGDHPITAQAIAKSVGIITASHRRSTRISLPKIDKKVDRARNWNSIVVPGDELAKLSEDDLRHILTDFNEIVFARTSPQQKLRIVENFQALGKIVAVTGDGVNDSPALKKADIGVAMGITGSDVSKQAADMILMDDNFASIVVGIEEGRKIFDNLKKTTTYAVCGNVSTLYPFIVFLVLGFPIPITTLLIMCICLGTDMMPAISLCYEKAESDIMKMKPRDPQKEHLVTRNLILWSYFQGGFIVISSGYMGYLVTMMQYGWMPWQLWQLRNGWDQDVVMEDWYGQEVTMPQRELILAKGQSAYFVAVVVCQWGDVIANKTRRVSIFKHGMGNWFTNFAILFETGLLCLIVYTPGLNDGLTATPVGGWPWCCGIPFAIYLLCYEELRKFIVRRWPDSWLGTELAR